jgi:uncharacterized phage protein (TIGR02216 family)
LSAAATPQAAGFPWEAAMAFGLGRLRLAPDDFWAATPAELAAAWRVFDGGRAQAPGRAALAALMARFPD